MKEFLQLKLQQLLSQAYRDLKLCGPYADSDISYCVGVISAYEKVIELLEEVKQ